MKPKSASKYFLLLIVIFFTQFSFGQTHVAHFSKVIVSPNITVTFIEGNDESVTVEKSTVSNDKIHIEVADNVLRIYLDGQKDFPKNKASFENGYKEKQPVYKGTVVTATVSYKTFNSLSIRGEETQICKSLLKQDNFKLKIYGQSHVILEQVNLGNLQATLYGEGCLEIKSGTAKDQHFIAYGDSEVKNFAINGTTAKITAYGDANFQLNASEAIKFTSFGDAKLQYKGNPEIKKGLNIGDAEIVKMD
jgi:ribosomal protein L31